MSEIHALTFMALSWVDAATLRLSQRRRGRRWSSASTRPSPCASGSAASELVPLLDAAPPRRTDSATSGRHDATARVSKEKGTKVQPAAFLRTTLAAGSLAARAAGQRALSLDLASRSHGELLAGFDLDARVHRPRDDIPVAAPPSRRLAVAAAAAVLTKNVPIATSVVDTVRRHPSLLAQTALTIQHLSRGRFILGLGSGEDREHGPVWVRFRETRRAASKRRSR